MKFFILIFIVSISSSVWGQDSQKVQKKGISSQKAAQTKNSVKSRIKKKALEKRKLKTRESEEKSGDLYDFLWLDQDKQVYVLQNKVYEKKHTSYINLSFIRGLEQKFQDSMGLQLKYGFFLGEEFALELFGNFYTNSNNSEYDSVRATAEVSPFLRRFKSNVGLMAIWAPFYGKINTFNKIIYFDWYFGAGISSIEAESNIDSAADETITQDIFVNESFIGAPIKTGFRVYINETYHVGFEYMNTSYFAPSAVNKNEDKWRTRADFLLNFGFSF